MFTGYARPLLVFLYFTASPQRFTVLLCVFVVVVVCVVVVAYVCVLVCVTAFLPQIAVVVRANHPLIPAKYHRREFAWNWVNAPPKKSQLSLGWLSLFLMFSLVSAVAKVCSSVLLSYRIGQHEMSPRFHYYNFHRRRSLKWLNSLGNWGTTNWQPGYFVLSRHFQQQQVKNLDTYNNPRGITATTTIKRRRTKKENSRQKAKRQRKQKPKDDASFPFLGRRFCCTDFQLTVNHIWQTC